MAIMDEKPFVEPSDDLPVHQRARYRRLEISPV
jgi:hypothetical protein